MTETDDRRPIYQRLSDELAASIARDSLRPGDAIPPSMELAARHQVALGTVLKALDVLVTRGLIERVQGSGTFVRKPDFGTVSVSDLRCFGSAGDRVALEGRILSGATLAGPREVTEALGLTDRAMVIRLRRLRTHDGLPTSHEEIWLDEARFRPVLTMRDKHPRLLYPVYEDLCGEVVACAREQITIEAAIGDDADLLGMVKGRPVVVVERIAFGYSGRPVEWRRSRSPASSFHLSLNIR